MIDKIDNALLSLATKTAAKREDITGKGKEQLQRIFYLSSSVGLATSAISHIDYFSFLSLILSAMVLKKVKKPPQQLVLQSIPPIIPASLIVAGSAGILLNLLSAEISSGSISSITLHSSFIAHIFGDYIGRVDTKGPPKKSKLAKLKDKAVETLAGLSPPKLSPRPIKNT